MTTIDDGRGSGRSAEVNEDFELKVEATTSKKIFTISEDDGRAFIWTSAFDTAGTNIEVLEITNTSTDRSLHLDSARYSSAVAQLFTVQKHTGTPSGTTITGEVLNFKSPNPIAESTALGDGAVTAGTIGNVLARMRVVAASEGNRDWNGEIILGEGDSIIVTASASGIMEFAVTGYFD